MLFAHSARSARARGARLVLVTDCRFANEAALVRAVGGRVVHLRRAAAPAVVQHVTEQRLVPEPDDLSLTNDGTIQELVRRAVTELRLGC